MKKIIDANYFQEPALEKYLSSDTRNKVVFNEYACMETFKGNPIENIHKSLEIVSKYPEQVIVLKGTRIIHKLKLSSKGLQKRFEDPIQIREFKTLCKSVQLAIEGDMQIVNRILAAAKVATNHFESLRRDTEMLAKAAEELSSSFQTRQLKDFRKKERLSGDLIYKIIEDITGITAFSFRKLRETGHINEFPSIAMLHNSYVFRFVMCSYLLILRWISDGNYERMRSDRRLNDTVDMNYAAYATFFDGLLTNDTKMKNIYLDACFLLNQKIKPIIGAENKK